MNSNVKMSAFLISGFLAGLAAANLPAASAAADPASTIESKQFFVSIDEVQQQVVFFKRFSGAFSHTVNMSDGTTRTITLTPMVHDGMQVLELNDTGHISYMSLNGRTTNGKLLVETRDVDEFNRQLRDQGWKLTNSK